VNRGLPLAALGVALLTALVPATASAAPPINDGYGDRLTLQLDSADTRSNAEATIEAGERLTANDPDGQSCGADGSAGSTGHQLAGTMWWQFTGNGGPITVSTLSSNFDTVLAVYEVDGSAPHGCNDDIQAPDPTRPNLQFRLASEMVLDTVAGREYAVQVGGCMPANACGAATGNVTLRVSSTPSNDDRAAATSIPPGGSLAATTNGATLESGELASCGAHPYAKTVWFRYTAPAIGTAIFSASGFDTVLAVYRAGSTTPIGCNDDAVEKQLGASRLPSSQPPGPPVEVVPGDYLIQIGGYYDPGFTTIAARNGALQMQVEFTEDVDLDDDGVDRGSDCNDGAAAIHPGAVEVVNDDIDQNCDGIKAFDRDGDKALARPAGGDCDDLAPSVHPGATDRPGNHIDEDCSGSDASPRPLESDVDLRVSRPTANREVLSKAVVRPVAARSRIALRCVRGRCGFDVLRIVIKRQRASVSLLRRMRRPLKLKVGEPLSLSRGVSIEVRVTKPGFIGRSTTLRISRRGKATARDRCLSLKGALRTCPNVQ
jgi:hypothetical protein